MSSNWAASALSWWSDAGVDTLVDEAPRNWLAPKPAEPTAPPQAPAAPPIPGDLDGFRAWFVDGARLPLGAPAAPRIAPAGDPASSLMVLVDMPGPRDAAAGTLISGAPGELFDRMLAAMVPPRSRETIYLASLSPLRTPTGRLDPAQEKQLAEIARHHIALVKPRAVLLFGDACARALLGGAVAASRGRWHDLSTPAGPVKALATIRPEKLEQQPSLKKIAWEDLQMLMEGMTA
jgi:DNA polymerase